MVICFEHPKYKGKHPPCISCRTCCHIFIEEVKRCRRLGEPIPGCSPTKKTRSRRALSRLAMDSKQTSVGNDKIR